MLSSSPDLPQKSLHIKQDSKFFSRLLSKESSLANPSCRVYYAEVPSSVPFMWESRPGTPKNTFCETTLPPLTPPPSYYSNYKKKPVKKHSRSSLLHSFFQRINSKKAHVSSSPSSSLSISSSSTLSWSSSLSVPMTPSNFHSRCGFSSQRSSFDSGVDDEEPAIGSPTSTLCFGHGREESGRLRGCYSVAIMKKALLSMAGHGSGQDTA